MNRPSQNLTLLDDFDIHRFTSSQISTASQSVSSGFTSSNGPTNSHTYASRRVGTRSRNPLNEQNLRTDFTSNRNGSKLSHHQVDGYAHIDTPPSDPPKDNLMMQGPDISIIPFFEREYKISKALRPHYIVITMAVAFIIGSILYQALNDPERYNMKLEETLMYEVGYWIDMVAKLYMNMMNCVVLPMAFCQVVVSVSELSLNKSLGRVWKKMIIVFFLIVIVSVLISMQIGMAFKSIYEANQSITKKLEHPSISLTCGENKFVAQRPDGQFECENGVQGQPNTTFPYLVDIDHALGFEEPVANVDISEYIFAVLDIYFPKNIIWSFGKDMYISVLVVACAIGMGITKQFRLLDEKFNPLLKLFTHMYHTLFTMLDWLQRLALIAIFPLLIGPMLTDPLAMDTLKTAVLYCVAVFICAIIQSLVIVPIIFYVYTKENPYIWMFQVCSPMFYAWNLQSGFLPLSMATRTVLHTKKVPPAIFGAVFPILAALNRSSSALGLPTALIWAAVGSKCDLHMNALDYMLLGLMCFLASLGDTALPRSRLALFLTMWKTLCTENDTPGSILAITGVQFITFRLTSACDTLANLMIVRIVAHHEESYQLISHIPRSPTHFFRG